MTEKPSHFTIRQWSIDDRPREKMHQKGAQQLTNAELLALLIGSGHHGESAVHLMQRLLCLLYTSPSPRDATLSRMPSSA